MNKVPRWVFHYVGNKTFDFSSKKRIFCRKTTKFSQKLAFLSIGASFGALLVGWLVVVARAVSRKTPIYLILSYWLVFKAGGEEQHYLKRLLHLKFSGEQTCCRKCTDQRLVIQELMASSTTRRWPDTGVYTIWFFDKCPS